MTDPTLAEVQEGERLLRAAPDMLAVLKRFNAVMDHMNESAQYEQLWYQLPPALLQAGHDAYIAIRKAEGKPIP